MNATERRGVETRQTKQRRVNARLMNAWHSRSALVRELRQEILTLRHQLRMCRDDNVRLSKKNEALTKRSPVKRRQLNSLSSASQRRDRLRRLALGDSLVLSPQKDVVLNLTSAAAFRTFFDLTEKQYVSSISYSAKLLHEIKNHCNFLKVRRRTAAGRPKVAAPLQDQELDAKPSGRSGALRPNFERRNAIHRLAPAGRRVLPLLRPPVRRALEGRTPEEHRRHRRRGSRRKRRFQLDENRHLHPDRRGIVAKSTQFSFDGRVRWN